MDIKIESNIDLCDKNWFQTGGKARLFTQPQTAQQFSAALQYAADQKLEQFVLGEGANILIADNGFDGLVIRPQLRGITVMSGDRDTVFVTAGAGLTMHELIEWCLDNQILGLEEFSGIPGTIGGSVCMNLHYYQYSLDQFFVSASIIDALTGEVISVDKKWFNFGYDRSRLQQKKYYLVNATFQLTQTSQADAVCFARGRRVEIIRHRTARYPSRNTCGSFFRNFHNEEVVKEINGKKIIYVAYYLDKVGIKGELAVGGAQVSHQHANMIVTQSGATTDNVIQLARRMQEMVYASFTIIPQPECQFVGFKEYPLYL